MVTLSTKDLIGVVLDSNKSDEKRTDALVSLQEKKDREDEVKWLIQVFNSEKDNRQKSWIISILGGIHTEESLDFVYDIVLNSNQNNWVKFWALTELVRTNAPRLESIKQLDKDNDGIVRNLAKRILIDQNILEDYLNEMKKELGQGKHYNNSAVLRGLQFDTGTPFSIKIENSLFDPIKKILNNRDALMDNRNLAAKVLGNFTHRKQDAIDVLCDAYKVRVNAYVRRSMIDSIIRLNDKCTIPTLLDALDDRDAEIRERAANGLVKVTGGTTEAIKVIVEELMEMSAFDQELINAIRDISITNATKVIKSCMVEDDPEITEKCLELLAYIGGEEAISTIQSMKTAAVNNYTTILDQTDKQVSGHFDRLMKRAHNAFTLKMQMHTVVFGIGVIVLLLGLVTAFSQGSEGIKLYMGLFAAGGGGLTIITVFYTGPLENIKENMTDLLEINVLFLGYIRQLNQIDASFKQVFLDKDFSLELMKETVLQIQDTMEKTMKAVKDAR